MSAARYLLAYFLILLSGALAVFSVNWIVDPYHVNAQLRSPALNAFKPEHDTHMLLAKAYGVRREKPQAIVIGSSRSGDGFNALHPGLGGPAAPAYNLGLDGGNIRHVAAYFRHAVAVSELRTAVVGLDYFMFNQANDRHQLDFDATLLAGQGHRVPAALGQAKAYFSFDALLSSARTVLSQKPGLLAPLLHGMRGTVDYDRALAQEGVRGNFARVLRHFAETAYLPRPGFAFSLGEGAESSLETLREMLVQARGSGVKLHLVINPAHAWDSELMRALGLWDGFEDWKRALVRLVEQEAPGALAGQAQGSMLALWDFSGYNSITTEAVPAADAPRAPMAWFLDAEHFNQKAGDLVLDRVLGHADAARTLPADFGVRLTAVNIEGVLARTRLDRTDYARTNPSDVAEVTAIAKAWLVEANSARGRSGSAKQTPQ